MPVNELEGHPYLNYLEDIIPIQHDYDGLIIGSFPVYSCTTTLGEDLNPIIKRLNPNDVKMDFFYCSNKSKFWYYLSSAFRQPDPTLAQKDDDQQSKYSKVRKRSIDFLQINKLLITDVIKQTNRRDIGDEDSNLWMIKNAPASIVNNLLLNFNIAQILKQHNTIRNLYFTATGLIGRSPFGWFREILKSNLEIKKPHIVDDKIWSLECLIFGKAYNVFLLPTPKARGIHYTDRRKNKMFVNYLMNQHNNFHLELKDVLKNSRTINQRDELKKIRNSFLIECYRQAFIKHNLYFSGSLTL